MNEYETMTHIGKKYGITCHQLGKILKKNKLRASGGSPSPLAEELGMVQKKYDGEGHYMWIWHVIKTQMLLERLGHKQASGTSTD